ncbi:MAG: ATPase [Actinobacteria bacterium]|nr:ATPase [Actinomycetota bacterium]
MAAARLRRVLGRHPRRVIACSGGVDSLLLAAVASEASPPVTIVAHAVTPAVPAAATARVVEAAGRYGWSLELVRSREFDDERYLRNPRDRCYFCKTNLYDELDRLVSQLDAPRGWHVLSGANVDDLGEYRPGLRAASERGVRHPYIEAGLTKRDIRAVARAAGLPWAELPASPCLASRLYTGTRVTAARLRAVEVGEELLRRLTGVEVVRCRVREDEIVIEVPSAARALVTDDVVARVAATMRAVAPELVGARLDDEPYRPGRAFLPGG